MHARLRQRQADGAREGPGGQVDARLELNALLVVARDVHERLRELVGQQPEAGDDARPAPAALVEVEDLDLHGVARLRALDEDGAVDRVHLGEIDERHVGGGGVLRELPTARVDGVELELLARRHRQDGLYGVVPTEVVLMIVDGLEAAHRSLPSLVWSYFASAITRGRWFLARAYSRSDRSSRPLVRFGSIRAVHAQNARKNLKFRRVPN